MDVFETANAISDMKIRGAGKIARAASEALADYSRRYCGHDKKKFLSILETNKSKLISSRPTAVSLRNGIFLTLKDLNEKEPLSEIRKKIESNSQKFVRSSIDALAAIAKYGAELIDDGDTILTHCNSQAAIGAINEAKRTNKKIKVYATESRPWGQGFITAKQLAEAGTDVTLVIDSAVNSVIKNVDKIFVGADTITAKGNLYNKIGTSQIAIVAKSHKKKFYVCSETYKFAPVFERKRVVIEERDSKEVVGDRILPDTVKIFNPVFDCTPAKLIENIVCEKGVIKPSEVRKISLEMFGTKGVKRWRIHICIWAKTSITIDS